MMTKSVVHSQSGKLVMIVPWACLSQVFCTLILLLVVPKVIQSQSIVKSLPGFRGDLPFSLETGYIGVGESDEVQLFYYFIESERNPHDDPLMLWLTGGPGCSALSGILYEIGPFTFNYAESSKETSSLELNPYSWTKVANIIFLDQPVGSGFSYGKTSDAYIMSDTLSEAQTYEFLRKWLVGHPKFLHNPLYIAGDSYCGIFLPLIVQHIYTGNEAGEKPWMNIMGYMLGNPLTDTNIDYNSKLPFAHGMSLISNALYQSARTNCKEEYLDVDQNNIKCLSDMQVVNECLEKIRASQILEPWCEDTVGSEANLLSRGVNSLGESSVNYWPLHLNQKPWCRVDNYKHSYYWANDKDVQKALNIRQESETHIKEWVRCNMTMHYAAGAESKGSYAFDIRSCVDCHRNLTNKNCRVIIYSGDHDLVVPYVGTIKWIESLNLAVEIDWKPWFVEGQIAGYTMKYSENDYKLTYATIKGGGHTAPEFKPKQCLAMVSRWLADMPL